MDAEKEGRKIVAAIEAGGPAGVRAGIGDLIPQSFRRRRGGFSRRSEQGGEKGLHESDTGLRLASATGCKFFIHNR